MYRFIGTGHYRPLTTRQLILTLILLTLTDPQSLNLKPITLFCTKNDTVHNLK